MSTVTESTYEIHIFTPSYSPRSSKAGKMTTFSLKPTQKFRLLFSTFRNSCYHKKGFTLASVGQERWRAEEERLMKCLEFYLIVDDDVNHNDENNLNLEQVKEKLILLDQKKTPADMDQKVFKNNCKIKVIDTSVEKKSETNCKIKVIDTSVEKKSETCDQVQLTSVEKKSETVCDQVQLTSVEKKSETVCDQVQLRKSTSESEVQRKNGEIQEQQQQNLPINSELEVQVSTNAVQSDMKSSASQQQQPQYQPQVTTSVDKESTAPAGVVDNSHKTLENDQLQLNNGGANHRQLDEQPVMPSVSDPNKMSNNLDIQQQDQQIQQQPMPSQSVPDSLFRPAPSGPDSLFNYKSNDMNQDDKIPESKDDNVNNNIDNVDKDNVNNDINDDDVAIIPRLFNDKIDINKNVNENEEVGQSPVPEEEEEIAPEQFHDTMSNRGEKTPDINQNDNEGNLNQMEVTPDQGQAQEKSVTPEEKEKTPMPLPMEITPNEQLSNEQQSEKTPQENHQQQSEEKSAQENHQKQSEEKTPAESANKSNEVINDKHDQNLQNDPSNDNMDIINQSNCNDSDQVINQNSEFNPTPGYLRGSNGTQEIMQDNNDNDDEVGGNNHNQDVEMVDQDAIEVPNIVNGSDVTKDKDKDKDNDLKNADSVAGNLSGVDKTGKEKDLVATVSASSKRPPAVADTYNVNDDAGTSAVVQSENQPKDITSDNTVVTGQNNTKTASSSKNTTGPTTNSTTNPNSNQLYSSNNWKCTVKNCTDKYAVERGYTSQGALHRHLIDKHPSSDEALYGQGMYWEVWDGSKSVNGVSGKSVNSGNSHNVPKGCKHWIVKAFLLNNSVTNSINDYKISWLITNTKTNSTYRTWGSEIQKAAKDDCQNETDVWNYLKKTVSVDLKRKMDLKKEELNRHRMIEEATSKVEQRKRQQYEKTLEQDGAIAAKRRKITMNLLSMSSQELAIKMLESENEMIGKLSYLFKQNQITGLDLAEWSGKDGKQKQNLIKNDVINQLLGSEPRVRDIVLWEYCGIKDMGVIQQKSEQQQQQGQVQQQQGQGPDSLESSKSRSSLPQLLNGKAGEERISIQDNLRHNKPLILYGERMRLLSNDTSAILISLVHNNNPQIPELVHLGRISSQKQTYFGRGQCPPLPQEKCKITGKLKPPVTISVFLQSGDQNATKQISRKHAYIEFRDNDRDSSGNSNGQWYLIDCSQFGVWVAGEKVNKEVKLIDGSRITFGGSGITYVNNFTYKFRIL